MSISTNWPHVMNPDLLFECYIGLYERRLIYSFLRLEMQRGVNHMFKYKHANHSKVPLYKSGYASVLSFGATD